MRTSVPLDSVEAPTPTGHRLLIDPTDLTSEQTPVWRRDQLAGGTRIAGPAIIEEDQTTTVVPAGFRLDIDDASHLILTREQTR